MAVQTISNLFIMGRLNNKQATVLDYLIIDRNIIFPIIHILNVIEAEYHADSLLTYILANVYNKIFDKKFTGYSEEDRIYIRFFIVLLITFEEKNSSTIHNFLIHNRPYTRFIDLFGIIRDTIDSAYFEKVKSIIQRLMIVNNDQYLLTDSSDYQFIINFGKNYKIGDRRLAKIKSSDSFSSNEIPLVIFDIRNIKYFIEGQTKIITPQMVEDRLPLDINRIRSITLEGEIVSVILPILSEYFNKHKEDVTFILHFVTFDRHSKFNLYQINAELSNDALIMKSKNITSQSLMNFSKDEILENESKNTIYKFIKNIKKTNLISINNINFEDVYPNENDFILKYNDIKLRDISEKSIKSPDRKQNVQLTPTHSSIIRQNVTVTATNSNIARQSLSITSPQRSK